MEYSGTDMKDPLVVVLGIKTADMAAISSQIIEEKDRELSGNNGVCRSPKHAKHWLCTMFTHSDALAVSILPLRGALA